MINAEEANKISLANQEKYELRKAKHLKKDMNKVHDIIVREAKNGQYEVLWDFRDSFDINQIEASLLAEGFKVEQEYPYFKIFWGDKDEITHKKFT